MSFDNAKVLYGLYHAEALLNRLDDEVRAWHYTKPYTFAFNVNEQFTGASVILKVYSEPPLYRWSLMFADVIHNVRLSLDHLIWAVARYESFTGIPLNKRVGFPLWDAPPNSDQIRGIRELSGPVRAAIERVQPYNRQCVPYPVGLLALLRDIDNGNKHHTFQLCMASVAQAQFKIEAVWQDATDVPRVGLHMGEIKGDTEIIRVVLNRPHPEMKCDLPLLSVIVAIKHPVSNAAGADRDDYAAFADAVIDEARFVIEAVSSAVPPIVVL